MSFGHWGAVKCGDFFCSFLRKKLTALSSSAVGSLTLSKARLLLLLNQYCLW